MSVGVELWMVAWWTPFAAVLVGYTAPKVARWLVRRWPTPRAAATYIETLRGIHRVSPLRASGEESATPLPDSSPDALTGVERADRPGTE